MKSFIFGGTLIAVVSTTFPVEAQDGWDIDCVNAVCAAVNARGKIVITDQNGQNVVSSGQIPGEFAAPLRIGCSENQEELCFVTDAKGRVWRSNLRIPNQYFLLKGVVLQ